MRRRDARSLGQEAKEELRRSAVAAVLGGTTQGEAARLFGVTRQTVCEWVKAYRTGGEKALGAGRKGRPAGGKLLPWQAAQVVRTLVGRMPNQLKLPYYLWTREAVRDLIHKRYGVLLSVWTVGRYLKRWGFTPQRPARRAFERSEEAVRQWLEQEYPAVRRQARREKAEIYWGDEIGLRSDHVRGTTYGHRGKTPVVPLAGKRFGCQMLSAVTNRGRLNFMVFGGKFETKVFIGFLRRLIRQVKRKVFLIVDGHPVHKARKVKAWVENHKDRLRLFYLPGYSPELNPDEYLNQDVKSNAVGKRRPRDVEEMVSQVRGYLRSRQRQPDLVKRYFQAEPVRYALA